MVINHVFTKQSPCNFRCEMSIRHCMQHESRQILASVGVAVVCDHFSSWQKVLVITLALVLFVVGAGDCEQPSVLLNVILKLTRRTKILKGQYVVNCCGEKTHIIFKLTACNPSRANAQSTSGLVPRLFVPLSTSNFLFLSFYFLFIFC